MSELTPPSITGAPPSSGKKTAFIRRRVDPASGGIIPHHALTEQQVQQKLSERAERERREQQEQQEQQRLFEQIQQEEKAAAEQQRRQQQKQPVSPTKRALVIKKVPTSAAYARENSPTRSAQGTVQPLALALPEALGVGPGSPGWNARHATLGGVSVSAAPGTQAWEVVGSPGRFREDQDRYAQEQRDELEQYVDEQQYESIYESEEKNGGAAEDQEYSEVSPAVSASQSLAQRLAAQAGATQPRPRKIAAPAHSAGKTWQHSQFLSAKKQAQAKAIHALVHNEVVKQEQDLVAKGLPTTNVTVLDSLSIRGQDLFAVPTVDEREWYAQRARSLGVSGAPSARVQGVDQEHLAREQAKEAKRARKRKAALAQVPWDAPVNGPSLVLSEQRLFFPLRTGAVARTTGFASEGDQNLISTSSTAPAGVPGLVDRVSRTVTLKNNGSTAVEWNWTKQQSEMEKQAKEKEKERVENGATVIIPSPLLTQAQPENLFTIAQASGTLLPGESVQCVFTFVPPSEGRDNHKQGLFIQRLALETTPKLSRALTQKQCVLSQETANSNSNADLTLTGSLTRADISSVDRAALYSQILTWKKDHLTASVLARTLAQVPTPLPPEETHRRVFWNANRADKLFFYQDKMSEWWQLSRDVFQVQKRRLRETLVWDFSAAMIKYWIEAIPQRNLDKKEGLLARYEALMSHCRIRPAPHQDRYDIAFGLVSQIAASIPRTYLRQQLLFGTSERLEQDVRKEREAAQKKLDEEAKAKLPFHLRGGTGSGTSANLNNLTPEQRKMREEEQARKAAKDAAQAEDDAQKLSERRVAEAKVSDAVQAEIRAALTQAISYFSFLSAPEETNLDPQAKHPDETLERAKEAEAQALAARRGEPLPDLAILLAKPSVLAASAAQAQQSAVDGATPKGSGKDAGRPKSGKKGASAATEQKEDGVAVENKDTAASSSSTKKASSTKKSSSASAGAPGAPTPDQSRPTTPRSSLAAQIGPGVSAAGGIVAGGSNVKDASADAFASIAAQTPLLLSPTELESLRIKSFNKFLSLETTRRAGRDTKNVRQNLVYFGNSYSTPDTGVHIPTPAEIKIKEERERMARYGQTVSQAVKDAEERRRKDMHPMSPLASRQIRLTAASVYFSLAYTREQGVWAWVANDILPSDSTGGSDDSLIVADAKKSASSKKAGAPGTKTKIQESRRAILALNPPVAVAPVVTATMKDVKASASKDASKGGKVSPRSSAVGAPKSGSIKKAAGKPGDHSPSRPGSGSAGGNHSARATSPAPGSSSSSVNSTPLVPLIPTALQSLGSLSTADGSPQPIYIPELQGLDIVSIAAGVHCALILLASGTLLTWEHASRRLTVLFSRLWPGQRDLAVHQETQKLLDAAAEDRAKAGVSLDQVAQSLERPTTSGGTVTKGSKGDGTSRSSASVKSGAPASGASKTLQRKPKKSGEGSISVSSEVLAIDSAAYEAESLRVDRLAKDADLAGSNKIVSQVIIGGSGTLSAHVHYLGSSGVTPPAADFEFALVLTEDGCVYSTILNPSVNNASATLDSKDPKSAKAQAKEKESSTAMLGLGEKTKDSLKNEKDHAKAAEKSGVELSLPLAQFELVTALHPTNLAQMVAGAASASSSCSNSTGEVRVIQLTAGYSHSLALLSDGSVWTWGNEGSHLGLGSDKESKKARFLPVKLDVLSHIALPMIRPPTAAGGTGTANPSTPASADAKSPVPSIKSLPRPGSGPKDQPGSGRGSGEGKKAGSTASSTKKGSDKHAAAAAATEEEASLPAGPIDPVISIVSGAFHNFALTASGAVFGWGRNTESQLGLGDSKDRDVPTLVPSISPTHQPALLAAAIEKANAPPVKHQPSAVGSARLNSGSGSSVSTVPTSSSPPSLSPFLKVTRIVAGGSHSLAVVEPIAAATIVDADGNTKQMAVSGLYSWGSSVGGATALGHSDDVHLPSHVPFFDGRDILVLVAGGDASQSIVQRQLSSSITLVVDEDDVPDAVII